MAYLSTFLSKIIVVIAIAAFGSCLRLGAQVVAPIDGSNFSSNALRQSMDGRWKLTKTEVWNGSELEKNAEVEQSYSSSFVPGQFGLAFMQDSVFIELGNQKVHGTFEIMGDKIVLKMPCNCSDMYKIWELIVLKRETGTMLLRLNDEDEGSLYFVTLLFEKN